MANRHRGEISAVIGGERRCLRLTLGALADLEDAFGAEDMAAFAASFAGGRLRAADAIRVIGAGLRGGGATVSDAEVAAMAVEGGAAGYARIVVDLLAATFGADGADGERTTGEDAAGAVSPDAAATAGRGGARPFPGAPRSASVSAP